MIHNFWSFGYIIERLKTTAENFGIKVKLVKNILHQFVRSVVLRVEE